MQILKWIVRQSNRPLGVERPGRADCFYDPMHRSTFSEHMQLTSPWDGIFNLEANNRGQIAIGDDYVL